MHNQFEIKLEGVEYISEKESSNGCEGCDFIDNPLLCSLARDAVRCSYEKIIWIKKEQPEDLSEDTKKYLQATFTEEQLKKLSRSGVIDMKYFSDPAKVVIKPNPEQIFESQLPGTKYDNEKLQYSLIPPYALEAVARNLTVGLRKYRERDNWKKVPNAEQRYLDALMRHLEAVRKGEIYDPESSEEDMPHMAAVAVNALFLLEFMLNPELKEQTKENKEST